MGSVAGVDVLAGEETVVASWAALAALSHGAELIRTDDAVAAVFPAWAPLNNAIVLGPADAWPRPTGRLGGRGGVRGGAGARLVAVVAQHGGGLRRGRRDHRAPPPVAGHDHAGHAHGPARRPTTGRQGRPHLDRVLIPRLRRDGRRARARASRRAGATGLDGWVLVHDGLAVAGAWTYRHGDDCGVYAVGTVPEFRRRGYALALVEHVLAESRGRGATTASLQSTTMGQPLYARLGFEAVGRYEEWIHATA